jgi:hypothetical protein
VWCCIKSGHVSLRLMRQVQGPGCSPRQACWSRPGGEREGEGERAVGVLVTRVGVWPLLLLLLSLQLQSLLLLARLNPSTPQQDGVHSSRASGPSLCTWAHAGRGCPVPLSGEAGRRNAATPPQRRLSAAQASRWNLACQQPRQGHGRCAWPPSDPRRAHV